MEVKYGAIDTDNYSCHGYYIINISPSPYTLQAYLCIDGQVIYSGEILCEGNYFFPVNNNSRYYVLERTKYIQIIVYLRTIINGNVKIICYDMNYDIPPCLGSISYNDYNTLSPVHTPMKEYDNTMDEKNQIENN